MVTAIPPVIERWLRVIETGQTAEAERQRGEHLTAEAERQRGEHLTAEAERQRGEHLTSELDDMLAEDAVFYSPAVFNPQRGRATTAAYLRAAEQMFSGTNFHYVEKWFGHNSAVLHFAAEVDGLSLEGIDMIHWNDEGKITSVKVMIRPFKALQGVIGRMAELLAAH